MSYEFLVCMKGFVVAFIVIALLMGVFIWHCAAPEEWRWLTDEQAADCGWATLGAICGTFSAAWLCLIIERKIERNSNAG